MIRKIGKKGKQWIKDRAKRIKEAVESGRVVIQDGHVKGLCSDCGQWRILDPDHKRKRSLGGSNDKENIDWPCRSCHRKRDQMGDPNKKKISKKKANWETEHACKSCKTISRQLICPACKKISI